MGAVLLSPVYVLLNLYLIGRMLLWFRTLHSFLGGPLFVVPFLICYILLSLSPIFAAFTRGKLKIRSKQISNYWLGILLYLLIFLLLADLGRILLYLSQGRSVLDPFDPDVYRITGGAVFGVTAILSALGIRNAFRIRKTVYEVTIHKACTTPSLRIALAADLHLGYSVGLRHVQKMRRIIDGIKPDLVLFAGDLFDNEYAAIQNPEKIAAVLRGIQSTCGSYACWGNHDIEELILAGFTFDSGKTPAAGDHNMKQFLKKAGIRLLADETILLENGCYLTGRLDASCLKKSGIRRCSPDELLRGLGPSHPLLVIDHQPSRLPDLAAAGADLVLSGHTHDGQLFPGNLTTRIGWMNSYGKLAIGKMTSIVTSGVGFWGPAMRIGTHNEVVEIRVTFDGDA